MNNKTISIELKSQKTDLSELLPLINSYDKQIQDLNKKISVNRSYDFSKDLYHKLFNIYLQKAGLLKKTGYKEYSLEVLAHVSEVINETLLFNSDNPAILYDLAIVHIRKSEFSDAQRRLEQIISRNPVFSISVYFLLSQIYKISGQKQKAQNILKLSKDSLAIINKSSYSKEYQDIMASLNSILNSKNDQDQSSMAIDAFFDNNIYHRFETLVDIKDHISFYTIKEFDNSIFRNIVRIEADICIEINTPLTVLLSYYNYKYLPELTLIATDVLQKFPIPDSELIEIYWQAVKIYENNGNIADNIRYTEKMVKLDPGNRYQNERLFELYLVNGEMSNAVEQFKIVTTQSTATTMIIRESATNLFRKGNSTLAIKICKTFLRLQPENAYIMKTLGDIFFWKDKYSHTTAKTNSLPVLKRIKNNLNQTIALRLYKQALLDQKFASSDEGKQLLTTIKSIED